MHTLPYLFGAFAFVVLLAGAMVVLLSIAAQSQDNKRREDLQSRRIAQQPWDARSADGRGNR